MICIADDQRQALREVEIALTRSAELAESLLLPGEPHLRRGTWEDQVARRAVIVGTPEHVVEQLLELQEETGYEHVLCYMSIAGGMPYEAVKRSMQLLSRRVMPRLRAGRPTPTALTGAGI
jgi:alkanesulfonate monooxygenase SsuD/methylene tetrahydromethanopterin reductase-like flavin-dependent oxidoreductase (luciferase family)